MTSRHPTNVPTPPSGTVTFLFTDIEGSSRLWETQHQAMQASLARHDALLRQCVEAHGGHIVKTLGDGVHAAFATASDALNAAIAAQQALHAEAWPKAAPISVRMALHSGSAELRDGDYYGPALNRVARLAAIAHGGQTLLSAATYDLCCDLLPSDVSLKALGEHSLKGLARHEAVFQLCHPDLPHAFPPLKTLLAPIDLDMPSIAVLPFTDLSPEKDQEYFTDGLAEELLNVLSKIRGVRVASRTSAFSFKGTKVDIPTVAQKLNVATVLEGSVRKSGKRVRITAQLIRVATDSHLWSETYDRELEDIFAVQDDIAQSVVKELRTALLGEKADVSASTAVKAEVRAATKERGANAEAYRLYLQGRFFEDRMTREEMAKAMQYYRQALELDPEYGLAWSGVSRCYASGAWHSWDRSLHEDFAKARVAAEKAVQLEPDLTEAHVALGNVRMMYDWDWKGADASFRRALELTPGDARVLRNRAVLTANLGRHEEAITLLRRAVALDPLSVASYRTLARVCIFGDALEEAEAAAAKVVELNPQGGMTNFWLGLVRMLQGRAEEALELVQRESHEAFRPLGLTLVQHARRRPAESDAALHDLIEKNAAGGAYQVAEAYAYRGETDLAFEWLERAYMQRDPGTSMMKADPLLRSLTGDPRWRPFVEKMGLAT